MKHGVLLSVASSFPLGVGMAILVVVQKHAYMDSIAGGFFAALILWGILGGIFSLMGALVVGIPLGVFLEKARMFRWYVVVPIGAAVSYAFGISGFVVGQANTYVQITFAVYGGVGALAFWYGAVSAKSPELAARNGMGDQ